MPTYIHTHIHHDRVITISAPPYYVVGADRYRFKVSTETNGIRLYSAVNAVLQTSDEIRPNTDKSGQGQSFAYFIRIFFYG